MTSNHNPDVISGTLKDSNFTADLITRHRVGRIWRVVFRLSTVIGIIGLILLLLNIINSTIGYTAVENQIEPERLAINDIPIENLHQIDLIYILKEYVSERTLRRLEYEQAWDGRSREELYRLVIDRVVQPTVVGTWSLFDSIFHKDKIINELNTDIAKDHPNAILVFKNWLTIKFITSPQSPDPEVAGIRTAILGSLWVILITILFAFPVGVMAAIYLEEYASNTPLNRLIQTNISNLAGVPSIVYGMLGLAIFVRTLEALTSGAIIGVVDDPTTANGRTILSAGLTLGLLILPLIIINSQEAIRAVPNSLRQASYGLGGTKWQTVWYHVLPSSMAGILTGTILAISRAIGETAPLVVVGASTYITVDPSSPFSKFTTLPIQIYQWTSRPQNEFRSIAAAAIIVLLFLLISLNATAVLLRNRYTKRLRGL